MKKWTLYAQSVLFLAFLGAFFVLNLALPDRDFSEQENRFLQSAPKFSFSELFAGKFAPKFETYVTDQFAFRDTWTAVKARSEQALGKNSNNGIFLCKNETLIEPYTAPAMKDLKLSLGAIDSLAENAGIPVYFALIPSASEIWQDKLPAGTPNDSQKEIIDAAYATVGAKAVDIYGALAAHADEPIYYRTDHHWTTLGAYYGYCALMDAMELEPVPLSEYTERTVTEQFYGTAYSASGYSWIRPDTIRSYVQQGDAVITNYPSGTAQPGSLYDESVLTKKDKYKYFYGGNTPLLTIETGLEDAPSLLILRDSYMDSLSPFLMAHFSEIHILDLRYYRAGVKAYIDEHDIDNVLVCYNVKNFSTDGNIFLAAK